MKALKKHRTSVNYGRLEDGQYDLFVTVLADASRQNGRSQLCYLAGLIFGDLSSGSTFHTLSWTSYKSKRPVKSVTYAETLAPGEAIDEGKVLVKAIEELLCTELK